MHNFVCEEVSPFKLRLMSSNVYCGPSPRLHRSMPDSAYYSATFDNYIVHHDYFFGHTTAHARYKDNKVFGWGTSITA